MDIKKKPQIFVIHGGMTFKSHRDYLRFLKIREISLAKKIYWSSEYLQEKLGKDFEIIRPRMPLQDNAKYSDWKIHFERHFPQLRDNIILIGSSLGGIFLAKYLSEHKFPKKILAVYLICAPYDDTLPEEDLAGGFRLKFDLSQIEKNSSRVNLLFSKNDDVVPAAHADKYARRLKNSKIIIYPHINGHFKISKFPEIVKMIRDNLKNI
jgi:predicted alpha/beta hydrolase family esterase